MLNLSGLLVLLVCIQLPNGLGHYSNNVGFDKAPHECERVCAENATPKTCRYHFYLEWYVTMSKACYDCPHNLTDCERPHCVAADGQRRQFISINRQLPGPKIEVCEGDTIQVKLSNRLGDGRVAAFHWHGQLQTETPWMDGVPYVTQCPIMPGQDFTYKFKADPPGTYMYHSHVGLSLTDGVFGPLVVKQPQSADPNSATYDHNCTHTPSGDCEYVMLVTDWTVGEGWGDYMMARWHSGLSEFQKSGLLNGKNAGTAATNATPYEVFVVQPNKRYRFRGINLASTECRYRISIHSHNLTVIATDGLPVKPHVVDAITYFPGERFDFVVQTDQDVDNYWLQGWPIGECGDTAAVYAVLRYAGAGEQNPDNADRDSFNFETHLNPIIEEDDGDWGSITGQMRVSDLQGYESIPNKPADVTYYVGMDEFTNNGAFNHPRYYSYTDMKEEFIPDTAVFNNITFIFPASPVLYQYDDIDDSIYCDQFSTNQSSCYQQRCHCTHRVKVPKDSVVEMVLVNEMKGEGAEGHPIHVHGAHFHLLGMGKIKIPLDKWEAKRMNDAGELPKNFANPPIKDTVQITGGGYAIIRFTPSPGVWLMHCHIQWHRQDGQALILQVGDPEDFPEAPQDIPRCGAYPNKNGGNRCKTNGATSVTGTMHLMLMVVTSSLFAVGL